MLRGADPIPTTSHRTEPQAETARCSKLKWPPPNDAGARHTPADLEASPCWGKRENIVLSSSQKDDPLPAREWLH